MSEYIIAEQHDKILSLQISRADKKNALNLAMYSALTEHIEQAADNGSRVILLSGEGACFTSGNDLVDFASSDQVVVAGNPIERFIFTVLHCPLPIVVAVQGVAVGIGTTLLLHSDLVYAHQDTQFRLPFVNLGLCPEFASSLMLPRLAGHAKAAEWLMLGEFFSAAEARQAGIVNAVVEDPYAVALEQAQKLAKQPPAALRSAKALLKDPDRQLVESVVREEFDVFGKALKGLEFAEAVAAFFEKRAPDFSSFK